MNKLYTFASLVFVCLTATSAVAEDTREQTIPITARYPLGEKMVYDVRIRGFGAGEAIMRVQNRAKTPEGEDTATLSFEIKPSRVARIFGRFEYSATSIVALKTGAVLNAYHKEIGSKKKKYSQLAFDTKKNRFIWNYSSQKRKKSPQVSSGEIETFPVQDLLGMFYEYRRRKFELITYENLNVLFEDKLYPVKLAADGIEPLELKGVGKFWAVRCSADSMPGLGGGGSAELWVEYNTHVLLKMKVNSSNGSFELKLKSAWKSALGRAERYQ